MALINQQVTSEGKVDGLNYRTQFTTQATAASTFTFTTSSQGEQHFTGSTAGQIVSLGIATNYSNGQEWYVLNDATVPIAIQDSTATALLTLQPTQRVRCVLKDNSTSAGVWVLSVLSTVAATAGGLFIANFSSTANSNMNVFLNTFGVANSDGLPATIPINGTITRVTIGLSGGTGTGTFEFRVNTILGTAAFSVSLSAQQNASFTVSYPVSAGDQINCKVASGASGIAKPLVNIYM